MALSFDANFSSFSLVKSPPRDLQKLPTNNGLLMRNVVQLCLAANNFPLMRKIKLRFASSWRKTRLLQNIVICQCIADPLFASAILDMLTTDKLYTILFSTSSNNHKLNGIYPLMSLFSGLL